MVPHVLCTTQKVSQDSADPFQSYEWTSIKTCMHDYLKNLNTYSKLVNVMFVQHLSFHVLWFTNHYNVVFQGHSETILLKYLPCSSLESVCMSEYFCVNAKGILYTDTFPEVGFGRGPIRMF